MPMSSSEMGTPQRARMYPSVDDIVTAEMEVNGGGGKDERVYFAVGKDLKESKQNLAWVVKNFPGKKICFVYVLQPSQESFREGVGSHGMMLQRGRQTMKETLRKYLTMLQTESMLEGEEVHIEKEKVGEGIVELISLHKIKRLVVGAASDKQFNKKMIDIKSKTAKHVDKQAPASCHIWFICKGHLIKTREGESDMTLGSNSSNLSDCRTMSDVSSLDGTQRIDSPNSSIARSHTTNSNWSGMMSRSTSQSSFASAISFSATEVPSATVVAVSPVEENVVDLSLNEENEGDRNCIGTTSQQPKEAIRKPAPPRVLERERLVDDELYEQIQQAMEEADNSKREAFEETLKRRKAEKEAIEAARRAKAAEKLYDEEMRLRKEVEGVILRDKKELEKMKHQQFALKEELDFALRQKSLWESEITDLKKMNEELRDEMAKAAEKTYRDEMKLKKEIEDGILREKQLLEQMNNQQVALMDELNFTLRQKSSLDNEMTDYRKMAEDFKEELVSAVELLKNYRSERDEMEVERDCALRAAEELRQQVNLSELSTSLPQSLSAFSYSEIKDATRQFDPSLKIGGGGNEKIYKGFLHQKEVAIKILHANSKDGSSVYQREADVLSRLRHPNIVNLLGACPEASALVYEYLPNGSLEDRLTCKNNSSPLLWHTRVRIASDLCSVLIFLHSSKSYCIVHGNLKPSNIFLDANFVSKVSGFGDCSAITLDQRPSINLTASSNIQSSSNKPGSVLMRMLNDKYGYSDPFLTAGEVTPESDIYSFGIILLRLLTGKKALGITREVQCALDNKTFNCLLDSSAGDWPYVQAQQLAFLAVRCVGYSKSRPDLASEVLSVLESIKASSNDSAMEFWPSDEEHLQAPPPHFICPILQEVMKDPHLAADGYTYEGEAIQGWLDKGHKTSPMTNVKLAHLNLVPDHTLRSAIQEWSLLL